MRPQEVKNTAINIAAYLDRLTAYAQSRLADKDLAADAVQETVTKAVTAAPSLKDHDKLLPWLFAILRTTIIDLARKQSREIATADIPDLITADDSMNHNVVCGCFEPLIATLPSDYGVLIRVIELDEKPRAELAAEMGISVLNLNVKLHRARQALREAIEASCSMCAKHGCLNCTCH
jgi:RNA polymerase sigma factor (sigma-70 family)